MRSYISTQYQLKNSLVTTEAGSEEEKRRCMSSQAINPKKQQIYVLQAKLVDFHSPHRCTVDAALTQLRYAIQDNQIHATPLLLSDINYYMKSRKALGFLQKNYVNDYQNQNSRAELNFEACVAH